MGTSGPPTESYEPLTMAELRQHAAAEVAWLWDGYLAPGNVTLLTSQWKCGKTTLLSILLSRLGQGGTLAGLAVRPARAVVISEEGAELWDARDRRLDLGAHGWLCRPFRGRPRPEQWSQLVDSLAARRAAGTLDLVVIDPLAAFLPGHCENDSGTMLDALLPLQQLTSAGAAVLVLHHPRKGVIPEGQAARGSGALSGAADILIEMNWHGPPFGDDRRRRLLAFSRHAQTRRRLLIELNAEGTDYASLGDTEVDDFAAGWQVLFTVLDESDYKLTRKSILELWPIDHVKPSPMTLWRWLDRAVTEKKVLREGRGTRMLPFRYWLPGQIERWRNDPDRLPDDDELDFTCPIADVIDSRRLLRAAAKVTNHYKKMKQQQDEQPASSAKDRVFQMYDDWKKQSAEKGRAFARDEEE